MDDPTLKQLQDRAAALNLRGRSSMNKEELAAALDDAEKRAHHTAQAGDGRHYALRLTLGGAPNTLHLLPGLGYVRIDPPAPVGEPGEPTLEQAIKASQDDGAAVELVELTAEEAQAARGSMREARLTANQALAHALRVDGDMPQDRIDDEKAALTAGQEG